MGKKASQSSQSSQSSQPSPAVDLDDLPSEADEFEEPVSQADPVRLPVPVLAPVPAPNTEDDEGPAPVSQTEFLASSGDLSAAQAARNLRGQAVPSSIKLPEHAFGQVGGPSRPSGQPPRFMDHNDPAQIKNKIKEKDLKVKLISHDTGEEISVPEELKAKVLSWLESHHAHHVLAHAYEPNGELSCVSNLGQKCRFWLDTSEV